MKCIICKLLKDYDCQPTHITLLGNWNMLIVKSYGYHLFELCDGEDHIIFIFFLLFRSAPAAYGRSQARGRTGATAACRPTPQPQQCRIWVTSATYTTAQGNDRSLTLWARPGIEPASSWILVGFFNHWTMTGTPIFIF